MTKAIECLKDCDATCCKFSKYFRFSTPEVEMLMHSGTKLVPTGEVYEDGSQDYTKEGPCKVEKNGKCSKYGERSENCRNLRPGSRPCLVFRAEHPEEVRILTEADKIFQKEYFGWDEQ